MFIKLWDFLMDADDGSGAGSGGGTGAAATQAGAGASGDPAGGSGAGTGSGASGAGSGANDNGDHVPAALLNEDFTFAEGWQERLPDDRFADLKPTLANFRDLPSLGKALKDSMTAARAKTDGMVKVPTAPGKDAKPEEVKAYEADMAAFRKAYGVPDAPEGYKLEPPKDAPEGVTWNPDHAAAFQKVAHELGLTPAQAQKLAEFQTGLTSQQYQANVTALQKYDAEQDATVLKAFGDHADKRMVQVKQACMTLFGSPELPVDRASLTIGLAKLADLVSEDKLVSAGQVVNKLGPAARAREIQMDPKSPFNNPSDPRHLEQREEVLRLNKQAFPAGA